MYQFDMNSCYKTDYAWIVLMNMINYLFTLIYLNDLNVCVLEIIAYKIVNDRISKVKKIFL